MALCRTVDKWNYLPACEEASCPTRHTYSEGSYDSHFVTNALGFFRLESHIASDEEELNIFLKSICLFPVLQLSEDNSIDKLIVTIR